jgi:cytochrome c oxidase subunit 2
MMQRLLGLPVNASEHGAQVDLLVFLIHVLMLVIFVGWLVFFIYTIARFRRSRNARANHAGVKGRASSFVEFGVAIAEIALLIGISIPFWSWKVNAFPTGADVVRIRVIAQQFAWNIHYPGPDGVFGRTDIRLVNEQTNPIGLDRKDPRAKDDITTVNQLHIPVDKPVILELSTKDVVHSFSLPVMRVKQDTIPGMSIPVHFRATQTSDQIREQLAVVVRLPTAKKFDGHIAMADYAGILKKGRPVTEDTLKKLQEAGVTEIRIGPRHPCEIACAQLCGLGHYRMKGFLTIHDQKGYDAWLKEELEALE